ncbi:glycosyltransferase family 2 protein [Nakamurella leprariae]|uniref:Glycosyltransferase n=1 Tax=Nakamurella leprariae TaxID=2803911 RepID=A0A938YHE2_9ACTN|nr:glycosyltransferase [Nakamurella leprariae]MBM9467868.1 glycosyltransferase [Nakamurella leprariae]
MTGSTGHEQHSGAPAAGVVGVWCTELELSDSDRTDAAELRVPAGSTAGEVRVLLRAHGRPVAFVQLPLTDGAATVGAVHAAMDPATAQLAERELAAGPSPAVPADERISVVVCTRNRPDELVGCLDGLAALRDPDVEIVIVDNAPSDDRTEQVVRRYAARDPRFRYVREPRPGLSCARNRGLLEATGELLAYTDDDVRVDPDWLTGLRRGFARRADVGCVTGLVATASLDTAAEHYFDARVSWGDSCTAKVWDLHTTGESPLYPYSPGIFGTGANMAFRTALLRRLGGFDEALGAGTRTKGGEDLDIFVQVLLAGSSLAYEPSAVTWHRHRADLDALRSQMYGYGTGLGAYLTKLLLGRRTRGDVLRRIPGGLAKLSKVSRTTSDAVSPAASVSVPTRSLIIREFRGIVAGPVLYLLARRAVPAGGTPIGPGSDGQSSPRTRPGVRKDRTSSRAD